VYVRFVGPPGHTGDALADAPVGATGAVLSVTVVLAQVVVLQSPSYRT